MKAHVMTTLLCEICNPAINYHGDWNFVISVNTQYCFKIEEFQSQIRAERNPLYLNRITNTRNWSESKRSVAQPINQLAEQVNITIGNWIDNWPYY